MVAVIVPGVMWLAPVAASPVGPKGTRSVPADSLYCLYLWLVLKWPIRPQRSETSVHSLAHLAIFLSAGPVPPLCYVLGIQWYDRSRSPGEKSSFKWQKNKCGVLFVAHSFLCDWFYLWDKIPWWERLVFSHCFRSGAHKRKWKLLPIVTQKIEQ